MKRRKKRCSSRQIALRLCYSRLYSENTSIVWCNIQNLIKLSQRFRETTKADIRSRVLGEQVNIARIEPLGFVKVCLAPVPLTAPSCDVGQRFWDAAVIGQELTCSFKVTHGGIVIF